MNILQPNKSKTFKHSILPNLVRTGVIGDGSCFFHALYHATSAAYRQMSLAERVTYIQRVRRELAKRCTLSQVKQLGGGELYRMSFLLLLRQVIVKVVAKSKEIQFWDNELLPLLSNEWTTTSLADCQRLILSKLEGGYMLMLLKGIEQTILEQFKEKLKKDWVDDYCMEYLSELYQLNFFFVQASSRAAYKVFRRREYTTSLVFCWIDEGHYETMGVLLPGNRVERVFTTTHPIIQSLLQ